MNATGALRAALEAGIDIEVDGADLVLRAVGPPPPAVLLQLSRHKAGVVQLLRRQGEKNYPATEVVSDVQGKADSIVAEWEGGIAALSPDHPAEGFTSSQWQQFVDDAGRFCVRWSAEAVRLGWDALELFGVHVRAPNARYDVMGLVPMLRGGEVVALGTDRATIRMPSGNKLTYLKKAPCEAVAIWEMLRSVEPANRRSKSG